MEKLYQFTFVIDKKVGEMAIDNKNILTRGSHGPNLRRWNLTGIKLEVLYPCPKLKYTRQEVEAILVLRQLIQEGTEVEVRYTHVEICS